MSCTSDNDHQNPTRGNLPKSGQFGAYTRFVIVDHVGKLIVVSISQPGDLPRAVVVAATCLVSLSNTSNSAELGASPYPKGFRDIYAGVVPTVPGLYVPQ